MFKGMFGRKAKAAGGGSPTGQKAAGGEAAGSSGARFGASGVDDGVGRGHDYDEDNVDDDFYHRDVDDEDDNDEDDDDGDAGREETSIGTYLAPERYDGNILSSDPEKSRVLVTFKELRDDDMFCDITFVCHGQRFRAHRVIVSAWSRWLRALLCEEQPSEDVVSLDVFDPLSFGKVLDYMYGVPLSVTLETVETLLKVVHRLQLQGLEESIWIFLMKIVDPDNCEMLHDLADRYDCPPLKLMAWRILQESIPGYSSVPASLLAASAAAGVLKGTGLTGPGEPEFLSNLPQQQQALLPSSAIPGRKRHGADLDDHDMPSIFSHFTPPPPSENEEDEEDEDLSRLPSQQNQTGSTYKHPKELPTAASAVDLVKAWSARLNDVYARCNAPEGEDFQDPDTMEQEGGKKILLGGAGSPRRGRHPYHHHAQRKENKDSKDKAKKDTRTGFVSHIRDVDWRAELKAFYIGIGMPEKIPGLGEILQTWEGKEDQMLSHLIVKYKRQIPASLAEHLDTLQGYVEMQSESSFMR